MVSSGAGIGVALSLLTALSLAIHYLVLRIGMARDSVSNAIYVVNALTVAVFVPVIAVAYYPSYGLDATAIVAFLAAGVVGTAVGRAFTLASVHRIGASRTDPIKASSTLVATILGVLVLGETLTAVHAAAVVLIVLGVAVISVESTRENPFHLSQRQLLLGMAFPLGAAVAYGLEPVFATVGLERGTPPPVGLTVKAIAAYLSITLYLRWRTTVPPLSEIPPTVMRWYILGGISSMAFLLCYYTALSISPVSVVVPVVASSTLFIIVLSALFMPRRLEVVTWRLVAAAMGVVVGVAMIGAHT